MHRFYSTKSAVVLIITILFSACSMYTEINLRADGSAHVTTPIAYVDTMTKMQSIVAYQDSFYNSPQISGLAMTSDSMNVTYHLVTIDSVGNYMCDRFNRNYFQFRYNGDTLRISENGTALKNKHSMDCCTYTITVTSARKIKSVQSNNSSVKHNDNQITIVKKPRHMRKDKKQVEVIVVFE